MDRFSCSVLQNPRKFKEGRRSALSMECISKWTIITMVGFVLKKPYELIIVWTNCIFSVAFLILHKHCSTVSRWCSVLATYENTNTDHWAHSWKNCGQGLSSLMRKLQGMPILRISEDNEYTMYCHLKTFFFCNKLCLLDVVCVLRHKLEHRWSSSNTLCVSRHLPTLIRVKP